MKSKFVFTDITTNEQFIVTCLPHEVHSIELKNNELNKWATGRILTRTELYSEITT